MPSSKDVSVLTDLSTLSDRLTLCSEMLVASPSPSSDEALLSVLGFLEACAPRLLDLIDAGASGVLEEETLMRCLAVNDALTSLLAGDVFQKGKNGQAARDIMAIRGEGEGTAMGGAKANSEEAGGAAKGAVDLLGLGGGGGEEGATLSSWGLSGKQKASYAE